ncbi:hypothetical protein ACIBF1_08845 [Spirillospora sp. NPDC050679]
MEQSQHYVRRTVAVTGLATASVSASACGTRQASVSSTPQPPLLEHVAHVTSSGRLSYRLNAYALSLHEVALIEKAHVISACRCLSALEFVKPASAIATAAPQKQDYRTVDYLSPKWDRRSRAQRPRQRNAQSPHKTLSAASKST